MMNRYFYGILVLLVFSSCTQSKTNATSNNTKQVLIENGIYGASFEGNDNVKVPFVFEISGSDSAKTLCVWNAKERIPFKGHLQGDSLVFPSPVFNTYLIGKANGNAFNGYFVYNAKNMRVPFHAELQPQASAETYIRFRATPDSTKTIVGQWKTSFTYTDQSTDKAIGEFFMTDKRVFGSFLSETGDYRYLEGMVSDGKLMLSGFDGAVIFLFTGTLEGDKIVDGAFFSGTKKVASWSATKGVDAHFLQDADKMSKLKNANKLSFQFPSVDGGTISLSDNKYKGKVVIVQIMGTWCHNCMDETAYLSKLYEQYKSKRVEIIGLAFENQAKTLNDAIQNVLKSKQHFNVDYDLAIATYGKENKADSFIQQLDGGIKSFPSTIYIGKDGKVKKIHVGFSGPGTSEYNNYVNENANYINQLLKE